MNDVIDFGQHVLAPAWLGAVQMVELCDGMTDLYFSNSRMSLQSTNLQSSVSAIKNSVHQPLEKEDPYASGNMSQYRARMESTLHIKLNAWPMVQNGAGMSAVRTGMLSIKYLHIVHLTL